MRITISVNQKVGQPNYGSAGACCEIALDLAEASVSDHPESLVSEIRRAYALAQQAVFEQLERQAANNAPADPPPPRPDRRGYPSQGRPESEPDRDPDYREPNQPRRQPDPPRRQPEPRQDYPDRQEQRRGADSGGHNGLPRTGRELYPWAKKQEEAGCRGLVRALKDLGGRMGYPEMLKDWNHEETREAIGVWRQMDADPEPARNGYHNGNSRN
jgi:hypothetical protein